jgi:KDO2-lipid IV(A) lauroyltransferase
MSNKTENQSFKHPKYWLTHVGLVLLKLIALLPSSWRKKLGLTLGWLMLKLAKNRYRIAKINLGLCFPQLNTLELEKLVADNMAATGCGLIEAASCWNSDLKKQHAKLKLVGKENLDNALLKGKGVILLSYHMTSLEMGGCLLGAHYDFLAMYKPNKNSLFEKAMCDGRLKHLQGLLDRNNLRGTIKALKSNQIVWYAADQNYGGKTKVFVPFFDIQTATITATTKLAKITGATVVPFTQRRLEGNDQYELVLHPAFENFPGVDEEEDTTRINGLLEEYLKQYPVDYMWLHQRFRARPEGEEPIY